MYIDTQFDTDKLQDHEVESLAEERGLRLLNSCGDAELKREYSKRFLASGNIPVNKWTEKIIELLSEKLKSVQGCEEVERKLGIL